MPTALSLGIWHRSPLPAFWSLSFSTSDKSTRATIIATSLLDLFLTKKKLMPFLVAIFQCHLFLTNRHDHQIAIECVCATNPQWLQAKLDANGVAMKAPNGVADITWRLESDRKFSCMRWSSSDLIYGKKTIGYTNYAISSGCFRLMVSECCLENVRSISSEKGLKQVL